MPIGIGTRSNHFRASAPGVLTIKVMGTQAPDGLSEALIRKVIANHQGEARACWNAARKENPNVSGRMAIYYLISDGRVATLLIDEHLGDFRLEQCVAHRLKRRRFDAPSGGMAVVIEPFVFPMN